MGGAYSPLQSRGRPSPHALAVSGIAKVEPVLLAPRPVPSRSHQLALRLNLVRPVPSRSHPLEIIDGLLQGVLAEWFPRGRASLYQMV